MYLSSNEANFYSPKWLHHKSRSCPWYLLFQHSYTNMGRFYWFYLLIINSSLTTISTSKFTFLVQTTIISFSEYSDCLLSDTLFFSSLPLFHCPQSGPKDLYKIHSRPQYSLHVHKTIQYLLRNPGINPNTWAWHTRPGLLHAPPSSTHATLPFRVLQTHWLAFLQFLEHGMFFPTTGRLLRLFPMLEVF